MTKGATVGILKARVQLESDGPLKDMERKIEWTLPSDKLSLTPHLISYDGLQVCRPQDRQCSIVQNIKKKNHVI